jgi:steroid 5-alpha reductase family enzyme
MAQKEWRTFLDTEASSVKTRPGYEEYIKRTSAFVLWFSIKEGP